VDEINHLQIPYRPTPLSSSVDISAASDLSLRYPPYKAETSASSATRAPISRRDLGDIFGEEKVTGKAGGQNATNLNDTLFPHLDGFEREGVSDDHVSKRGNVLVSRRAIGIYDTHVFYHTVEIDHVIRATPEDSGQALVEFALIDSFVLQPFPTAAVKDVHVRHVESYTLRQ
jgi:hypothetical protein